MMDMEIDYSCSQMKLSHLCRWYSANNTNEYSMEHNLHNWVCEENLPYGDFVGLSLPHIWWGVMWLWKWHINLRLLPSEQIAPRLISNVKLSPSELIIQTYPNTYTDNLSNRVNSCRKYVKCNIWQRIYLDDYWLEAYIPNYHPMSKIDGQSLDRILYCAKWNPPKCSQFDFARCTLLAINEQFNKWSTKKYCIWWTTGRWYSW